MNSYFYNNNYCKISLFYSGIQALSEELRMVWGVFEGVLREAEQFVTTQTPMKAQGLQQSIEVQTVANLSRKETFFS